MKKLCIISISILICAHIATAEYQIVKVPVMKLVDKHGNDVKEPEVEHKLPMFESGIFQFILTNRNDFDMFVKFNYSVVQIYGDIIKKRFTGATKLIKIPANKRYVYNEYLDVYWTSYYNIESIDFDYSYDDNLFLVPSGEYSREIATIPDEPIEIAKEFAKQMECNIKTDTPSLQVKRVSRGIPNKKPAEIVFDIVNKDVEHDLKAYLLCKTPDDSTVSSSLGISQASGGQYVSPPFEVQKEFSQRSITLTIDSDSEGEKTAYCFVKYAFRNSEGFVSKGKCSYTEKMSNELFEQINIDKTLIFEEEQASSDSLLSRIANFLQNITKVRI